MRNLTRNNRIIAVAVVILCCAFLLSGCAAFDLLRAVLTRQKQEKEEEILAGQMTETEMTVGVMQREYSEEEVKEKEILTVSDARASMIVGDEEDEDELVDFPESCYAYSRLTDSEKKVYIEIYRSLCDYAEKTLLSSKDPDEVDKVFNCVMIDHPEIFYVSGYRITKTTLAGKLTSIDFSGRYTMSEKQIENNRKLIENYVNQFLDYVPETGDEFEKVKYLFDYLVDHTEFDPGCADSQNVCSVFIRGKSVCQGYSMAAKYLADEMGLFSTLAYGYANGTAHAWNIFRINGVYCHVDVTWGDCSYHDIYDGGRGDFTDYMYLGANDDVIFTQHETAYFIPMPECTSLEEYYFVRRGSYFEEPDRLKLMGLFQEAYEKGEEVLMIKCANREVFDAMDEDLFTDREVFQYLRGSGKARYIRNPAELTISFFLSV